jgi:predicted house-cleaning NTP pyrophosphatase (Maf/HAM1 superfamily)
MLNNDPSRRQFLAFLAGSPLLAAAGIDANTFSRLTGESGDSAQALTLAQQMAEQSAAARGPQSLLITCHTSSCVSR